MIQLFKSYILATILLGVGRLHGCSGVFPGKEVGRQVFVRLAPPSQTVESILRASWLAKCA